MLKVKVNNQISKLNYQKGFTLIEFLIYIAIFTILMMGLGGITWNVMGGGKKIEAIEEVSSNARFVLNRITYEVRKAKSIISPSGAGWSYRRPITISNSTSSLSDYQILVTLDTASLISGGKMRSDCGDIRFTDSNGTTQLNYWLEYGCNTTSTKLWVKVPSIPTGTKTIYLYYGNFTATSESDPNTVFINFSSSSTAVNNFNSWPYRIENFETTIDSESISTNYIRVIVRAWNSPAYIDVTIPYNGVAWHGFQIFVDETNLSTDYYVKVYDSFNNYYELQLSTCRYYTGEIMYWKKNGQTIVENYELGCGDKTFTIKTSSFSDPWSEQYTFNVDGIITYVEIKPLGGDSGNSYFYINYVGGYRKYSPPEPTTNLGTEENLSYATTTLSLEMLDPSKNPTIFDLDNKTLRIKQGEEDPIPLTSDLVEVSDLGFRNISTTSTPGTIFIRFTLSFKNPSGLKEYNIVRSFQTTVNLLPK